MNKIKTHVENIPAAAYCCWQGDDVGREAKLSLWTEFSLFVWWDHNYLIEEELRCG